MIGAGLGIVGALVGTFGGHAAAGGCGEGAGSPGLRDCVAGGRDRDWRRDFLGDAAALAQKSKGWQQRAIRCGAPI